MARKEWVGAKASPSGTFVTCSLVEENLSAKATVKGARTNIRAGVAQARAEAAKMLDDLLEVMTT